MIQKKMKWLHLKNWLAVTEARGEQSFPFILHPSEWDIAYDLVGAEKGVSCL